MGWLGRLFDARDTLVRLLLLDLSGVGYLVFGTESGREPTAVQWVLAVLAFAGVLIFRRRPAISLIVQAALLAVAFCVIDDAMINQVGSSWALLELTMWARRPRTIWLCTGLLAAVYLAFEIGDPWRRFLASFFGLAVVVGLPVLLGMVVRTTRELGREAQERAAEEQRRRESESLAARVHERAAIARELHDVVAHHVASMVLRVGVARHVLPDVDPRVTEVFDDVHGTGTTALADLRKLVALLRNPDGVQADAALTAIDPSALPAALGAAVDTARRSGLVVEADIAASVTSLDAVRCLAVLRLTQEALTNVAKHAGTAARARLTVAVTDGVLHWEVADDGGGVAPADPPPGGGHGLTGMRERVAVLGGALEAGPANGGWRVRTALPAPPSSTTDPAASPLRAASPPAPPSSISDSGQAAVSGSGGGGAGARPASPGVA